MVSNLDAKLAEYRERFREAPVGRWATAQGTFDAVSGEVVTFRPDHTGVIERGRGEAVGFEWREKGERAIEVRYLGEEGDGEEPWDEIRYDFGALRTDEHTEVVLRETGRDGFWDSAAPLRHAPAPPE